MSPALRVAAVMAAGALAVPVIATWEGRPPKGYLDPVGIPTSCFGHTGLDVVVGRAYSDDECINLLAMDALRHGLELDRCLTRPIPDETRAAFTSFAFNVGVASACKSSAIRKLNVGDVAGACNELPRWVRANGTILPGLVRRRAAERDLCLQGLT